MNAVADFDKCQVFLESQLRPELRNNSHQELPRLRAITISRQAGCGAAMVAERLAQLLKGRDKATAIPWTIFDRNLIEQVLKDHHLPMQFAKYLPENRVSEIQDAMDELFGVHPSAWKIVEQAAETVLRLVQLGNVILIGRGANMITARLPGIFHVRLVAPEAERIAHARHSYNMSLSEAQGFIAKEDKGRARYLKHYFAADVDDPMHYHLVINTGLVSYEAAAGLIFVAATSPPASQD